jgi:hypothetical protein
MKVETNKSKTEFSPIELTITIENIEEASTILNIFNSTPAEVRSNSQQVDFNTFPSDRIISNEILYPIYSTLIDSLRANK